MSLILHKPKGFLAGMQRDSDLKRTGYVSIAKHALNTLTKLLQAVSVLVYKETIEKKSREKKDQMSTSA